MHNKDHLGYDILNQIIYRGEGNSSIVIALRNHAQVIRLLKKDGKIMKTSKEHHVSQHPMRSINFIHLIMKPLTEPFLSGATELVHLKSDLVNELSKRVEIHRPLHRLDKTLLLDDQYALVMDDLCTLPKNLTESLLEGDLSGPTMSIEIKPKQGFLPTNRMAMRSSTNNEQHQSQTSSSCIYGSTQLLKLARGRITRTSRYCPINLFSGCPVRMRVALEELLHNPQNNLRVFKDLVLAYGESNPAKLPPILEGFFSSDDVCHSQPSKWEGRLVDLIIRCLLNQHSDGDNSPSSCQDMPDIENSFNKVDFCTQHRPISKCKQCDKHLPSSNSDDNPSHKLPRSSVLHSVLRAQKLDSVGPYGAQNMLDWLINDLNCREDILEELSKPQMPDGFGSLHRLPHEDKRQFYFRKVWEFLVSLTAKDCSIIITLRRMSPARYESIIIRNPELRRNIVKERHNDGLYLFNVGIADLDQKMPLKIQKTCENLSLCTKLGTLIKQR